MTASFRVAGPSLRSRELVFTDASNGRRLHRHGRQIFSTILQRSPSRQKLAWCHGHKPAVVIELSDQRYDKIVATVDNPEEALSSLSQ
jgi:hypothetical protein